MTEPPGLFPYRDVTENSCRNGHIMVRWADADGADCPVCRAMRLADRRDLASDLDALPVEVIVRLGGRLADEIRRR